MGEFDRPAPEFDLSQYPEIVGCKVMPQMEKNISEVEVQDAEGNASISKVPSEAVRRTNMPLIVQMLKEGGAPNEITKQLEDDIAIGLLSCRIAERFDGHGLVRIEVPAVEGASSFVINEQALGRRR